MKEEIRISYFERIASHKKISDYIAENRDFLLGEDGLNKWEYFIDLENKDLVLRTELRTKTL